MQSVRSRVADKIKRSVQNSYQRQKMTTSNAADLISALNTGITYTSKYLTPLLYIIGNIGNILSALIFHRKSWKKNVCVFYFKIYLLYNSLYINCILPPYTLVYGYNIKLYNSNTFLCKLYMYCTFLFSTLSPTVLILASIDRLLISSQNVNTRLYSSRRLAYFSISLGTSFWIFFQLHFLIKTNIQEYYPGVFLCYYDLSKSYLDFVIFSVLTINIFFCVVMSILSVLSFQNIRYIRPIPRQQSHQLRSMTKKDFQLLRCLFAQILLYTIFSIWINLYRVYSIMTKDRKYTLVEQTISDFLSNFGTFFSRFPYCVNFFIFTAVSKVFRQQVKRIFYKLIGKNLIIPREEEQWQNPVELHVVNVNTITM